MEVQGLRVSYGSTDALKGLNLQAKFGHITAVVGRNGAGKTTALEVCEGLRRADSGSVEVLGLSPTHDAAALHPRVGVMLQDGGIPTTATPAQFLKAVAGMYAQPRPVDELLDWLGLAHANRPFRRLSGGEQQRVKLAAALVGRPELVFLDEPSTGLDPAGRNAMWELLHSLRRDGVTIVLSTHLMVEAETLADEVVVIHEGRTVATGALTDLVGATSDVMSFSGPMHLDIETLHDALAVDVVVQEVTAGRYQVSGEVTPQVIASVTAWCAQHGVTPRELSVGRRSLEDVFLELTEESR